MAKRPAVSGKRALQEASYSTSPTVDRENGLITDVKVLGRVSKNGREYSDAALDDACRILEGATVNIDHNRDNPQRERGFLESVGTLVGLEKRPDGVYAKEFRLKKEHPYAGVIFESAERFPKDFGLSINAEGEVVKRGKKWVVESLVSAQSVDLVGKPATTAGLFESLNVEPPTRKAKPVKITIKKLVENKGTPEVKARLIKLLEDGGDSAMLGQPIDVPELSADGNDLDGEDDEADPMDQIADAFGQLVLSVMNNEALDLKAKIAQITAILTTQDDLINGTTATPDKPTSDDAVEAQVTEDEQDPDAMDDSSDKLDESVKKTIATLAANQRISDAKILLMESRRTVTPERIKSLVGAKDDSARQSLIESWPEMRVSAKPSQSAPLFESRANAMSEISSYPKDAKSFANAVR